MLTTLLCSCSCSRIWFNTSNGACTSQGPSHGASPQSSVCSSQLSTSTTTQGGLCSGCISAHTHTGGSTGGGLWSQALPSPSCGLSCMYFQSPILCWNCILLQVQMCAASFSLGFGLATVPSECCFKTQCSICNGLFLLPIFSTAMLSIVCYCLHTCHGIYNLY